MEEMDRVLVVDDDPEIRDLVSDLLEPAGYVVQGAADGHEALAVLQHEQPSLILLDMCMPHMSGPVLAETMRANAAGRKVPVVVITAEEDGREWAEEIGAACYLPKPFTRRQLLETVRRLCGQSLSAT